MDKEQKKRLKIRENRKKKIKNFIKYNPKIVKKNVKRFVLIEICFLLLFFSVLFFARDLTEKNTVTRDVKIESVRIEKHRGRRSTTINLYCMIDGEEAVLPWSHNDMDCELAAEMLPKEQKVTIITQKHKQLIGFAFRTVIVDARTEATVYHDIEDVNAGLLESRLWLGSIIIVLCLVYKSFILFVLYLKFN